MGEDELIPTDITYHRRRRELEIEFLEGTRFTLPATLLRVYSPSAEVRRHGKPVLQTGKEDVEIQDIQPVGTYAIQIVFSDGHDTGIYRWSWLYELGKNQKAYQNQYVKQLKEAGY